MSLLLQLALGAALASATISRTQASDGDNLYSWGRSTLPSGNVGKVKALAAGYHFTLALKEDGTLAAWGASGWGLVPLPAGIYTAISTDGIHALAIREDGLVVGWGNNGSPQAKPRSSGGFSAISAGESFSLGLKYEYEGGRLVGLSIVQWGESYNRALWPPDGIDFKAVAAGRWHAVALKEDGSLVAWGVDAFGETDAPAGTDFVAVAAGTNYSLALRDDGSIVGWGRNDEGQIDVPTGAGFKAISAGAAHGLALRADGSIAAWGSNTAGQATPPPGPGYKAISAGVDHSVAVKSDDTFVGWGDNTDGESSLQIVDGYTAIAVGFSHDLAVRADGSIAGFGYNSIGQATPPIGNEFVAVAVGDYHSLALRGDGSILAWGADDWGQVGNKPAGNIYQAIACGSEFSLALTEDGALAAWGSNNSGETNVPEGSDFKAIAAAKSHGLALKNDGSVVGWGTDSFGQSTPPAGNDYTAIATGRFHSLALKIDGSIVGWGRNAFGETTPPEGTGYTAIAVGDGYSLALDAAGRIVQWGDNGGDIQAPPSGRGFTQIGAGFLHALALRSPTAPADPPVPEVLSPQSGLYLVPESGEIAHFSIDAVLFGDISSVQRVEFYDGSEIFDTLDFEAHSFPYANGSRIDYAPGNDYRMVLTVQAVNNVGDSAISEEVNLMFVKDSPEFRCFVNIIDNYYRWFGGLSISPGPPQRSGSSSLLDITIDSIHSFAAAEGILIDLDLFRRFRDEVLATTPAGRYYTDLYERMSLPLLKAIAEEPGLIVDIHQALLDWTPAIQAVVNGQGNSVVLTGAMVTMARDLLSQLRVLARGELAEVMNAEIAALDPESWAGKRANQLLDIIESQTRPPPTILTHPVAQSIAAGGAVTLSVEAEGAGPFAYQWFKDGVAMAGGTDASYTVSSAQRFHAGDYTVTVSNPFGEVASNSAAFAVDDPPSSDARLLNLSTRGLAQTGGNVLIPGFVIEGVADKRLLIRAIGPTLGGFDVKGVLPDPMLVLKRNVGGADVEYANNDNWGTNTNAGDIVSTSATVGAFTLAEGSSDAALLVDLPPGRYTAIASGVGGVTGIAIVELYDTEVGTPASRLINISNRGFSGLGAQVMIPGFVISPDGPKTLLVRVVGPTLDAFDVAGTMADPKLTVFRQESDGSSTPILSQDNWGDNPDAANTELVAGQVGAFPLAAGSADAAFVITLDPGAYTVVGSSADGTSTGVVLVEVYIVR